MTQYRYVWIWDTWIPIPCSIKKNTIGQDGKTIYKPSFSGCLSVVSSPRSSQLPLDIQYIQDLALMEVLPVNKEPNLEWENASVGAATRLFAVSGFPRSPVRYSRGLKSEQFSWMWTNRLRKSRHDRVTAGSQQSIKTQGDCLHLKGTKYHYNKHERAHPSHCRLLFCQHCFALQTIILPQWFDLRRSKTEWTPERPPNDPWFMSCQDSNWPTTWGAKLPAPPHPMYRWDQQGMRTWWPISDWMRLALSKRVVYSGGMFVNLRK